MIVCVLEDFLSLLFQHIPPHYHPNFTPRDASTAQQQQQRQQRQDTDTSDFAETYSKKQGELRPSAMLGDLALFVRPDGHLMTVLARRGDEQSDTSGASSQAPDWMVARLREVLSVLPFEQLTRRD